MMNSILGAVKRHALRNKVVISSSVIFGLFAYIAVEALELSYGWSGNQPFAVKVLCALVWAGIIMLFKSVFKNDKAERKDAASAGFLWFLFGPLLIILVVFGAFTGATAAWRWLGE